MLLDPRFIFVTVYFVRAANEAIMVTSALVLGAIVVSAAVILQAQ